MQYIKTLLKYRCFILFTVGFVLLFFALKYGYRWIDMLRQTKEPPLAVQTVTVKEAPMSKVVQTIGSLTAGKEIKLKATAPGKIAELCVEAGSFVRAGTELITIIGGAKVTAPFDGYLGDWQVKLGDYVTVGTELADFVNTDLLSVTYRLPEQYAPSLDLNQEIELKVSAFPEDVFSGKLRFISPMIDRKTYTILLRAEIPNPNEKLWPGMSVYVKHILEKNDKALVVPESAIKLTLEGYELLLVSEGKLVRRPVTLGNQSAGLVQVISGVNLNDVVLLTQTNATKEGVEVTPVPYLEIKDSPNN